jgi:hypothetical protein
MSSKSSVEWNRWRNATTKMRKSPQKKTKQPWLSGRSSRKNTIMESRKKLKKYNSTILISLRNKRRKERKVKRVNDTSCKYFRPFFPAIIR